jgi:hypothetical protein
MSAWNVAEKSTGLRHSEAIHSSTHVAGQRAQPGGPLPLGSRLVALTSRDTVRGIKAVYGLLDGDEVWLEEAHRTFKLAFGRSRAQRKNVAGKEEGWVASAVEEIAHTQQPDRMMHGIVVAVQLETGWILGQLGGGCAYLCTEVSVSGIEPHGEHAAPGARCSVSRVQVPLSGYLVLANEKAGRNLTDVELWRTIRGCSTLQESATWLASVAAAHGGAEAIVLVIESGTRTANGYGGVMPESRSHRPGNGALVTLAGVVAVAAVLIVHSLFGVSSVAAGDPLAPTGLRVAQVSPKSALLAWSASPVASEYHIRLGDERYITRSPRLRVTRNLHPGSNYTWQVQTLVSHKYGQWSLASTLRVPLFGKLPNIRPISPIGTQPAKIAAHVPFCWNSRKMGQRFSLYAVGTFLHLHRVLIANRDHHSSSVLCTFASARPGSYFAWRLGAGMDGYSQSWSGWTNVWISARHPARRHARKPSHPVQPIKVAQPVSQQAPRSVVVQPPRVTFAATPIVLSTPVPPRPVIQPRNPQPVYYPTVAPRPVYHPPPPQPVVVPTQGPPPAPAPTSPIKSCPSPPNCT